MYQKVLSVLRQYLYEDIALNVSGVHLALRQEGETGYAVVTLDETAGVKLSLEQFYHISEQFREFLRKRNCSRSYFLYILITEDDSSMSRLFHHYEGVWRICPQEGRVMPYENTDAMFGILLMPLERAFELPVRRADAGMGNPKRKTWLPYCTIGVILLNVLIFLYTEYFSGISGDWLMDSGALSWWSVLQDGQWYRLVTCMFLHSGIDHIFNNMLMLAVIGYYLERQLGSVLYGILYFASGILAGCTSMVYNMIQNEYVASAGASGAIFGTVGAMLFVVIYYRGKTGEYTVGKVAFMALFSLYGGLTSQGVDNAAHIGGFISGFILAVPFLALRRRQAAIKSKRREPN
ncbi:MAG: rhomboid family intramembrane serine protease [Clostridiaceae bacterium]|nr:rhomboid family intramembrane serine protease [Clostridiaceae bacterium]